ncbi:MAG TPA: replicative DNA helicase [Candidatus Dependentiae bacterium]|nr:replicative DNA helicase [Candidatus Dependentiae bacterium]HRQ62465.1 replicative DNA helicase [Candidatus Dependentiae bacterium]
MIKKQHRDTSSMNTQRINNAQTILGRSLPANVEAEKSVLGALLLNDDVLSKVTEIVRPQDFYHPGHQTIFKAMLDLSQAQKRIDLVTLQDTLATNNSLDAVGGEVYLLSLQEDVTSVGFVAQHATIIREKSVLRELINSAADIIANCYSQENGSIESVLDLAEKTIFEISDKRTNQSFVQIDIWLKKTFQHLSDIKSNSKGITGIASGFGQLDAMTSGFQNGDLIVLAARPSMGKTALALCLGAHAARQGAAVGIFSLEMAAEQLTLRVLSSESGIAHHNIRNATITSQEWVELTNVAAQLAESKIFIDDTAMLDIMSLRAKARKLKATGSLDILIIDYLQLIHVNKRHENRHQEVSEISRSLKALAKELEIPIIALSQLSRAVDSRMDKRPMLSDLRESGAIEQDADVIMFLYRDIVYNPETEHPALAELIVGKQRNGPTGTVHLNFVRELTKFEEINDQPF